MTRRIVGLAQVEDIRSVPNAEVRAQIQIAALDISREFIIQRDKYYSIEDVLSTVRSYPYKGLTYARHRTSNRPFLKFLKEQGQCYGRRNYRKI